MIFFKKKPGKTLSKTTKSHQNEKSKTALRVSKTQIGVAISAL